MMKRYAFISYNHRDVKIAQWLHRKLEGFKLPNEIHNEFEDSRYLRPVFRDQEDLNAGILGDELRNELRSSKYLIVICSPNSSKSKWVSDEIKAFVEWGRTDYIIPFIIDGTPYAGGSEECFPEYLLQFTAENPQQELLGINIREAGKEKALIRVVSRMLGIEFDVLWKRHERAKRRRRILSSALSLVAMCAIYLLAIPVSLNVEIKDSVHNLPPFEQARITVDGSEHSFVSPDTVITINGIPGYRRFIPLEYTLCADRFYVEEKGEIDLGLTLSTTCGITMHRNDDFKFFGGTVSDAAGAPIEGAKVEIEGKTSVTDSHGAFSISFDVEQQTETKPITISKEGYVTKVRPDEVPAKNLAYILYK